MRWILVLALAWLGGCAFLGGPAGISVAGVYGIQPRTLDEDGNTLSAAYLRVDPQGLIQIYIYQPPGAGGSGRGCYRPPVAMDIDAPLQGKTLVAAKGPNGEPAYQVQVGATVFGIYRHPDAAGNIHWFVRNLRYNTLANLEGLGRVVRSDNHVYGVTGAPLRVPSTQELELMQCMAPGQGQWI